MIPQRPPGGNANGRPPPAQPAAPRAIFRREALQRYIQNQERVVLPRLVTPRAFRALWVLAVITLVGGLLVAFWPWLDLLLFYLEGALP